MKVPLVSVCMITYNHEEFISEAIEGVLMQKTNFPIELIIGEDCGTDNTRAICIKYRNEHSSIVKLILPEKNIGAERNFINTMHTTKGKYIALCEGDDYWTDPLKLQKQVDFLESNPEFSICSGGYKIQNGTQSADCIYDVKNGVYTLHDLHRAWLTKTLTVVFRRSALSPDLNELSQYDLSRDVHLVYHLLKSGKGYYFKEILGVYHVHVGGIHSLLPINAKMLTAYKIYKEMYYVNKDEFTLSAYLRSILALLRRKECLSDDDFRALRKELFGIIKKPLNVLYGFKYLFRRYAQGEIPLLQ